MLRIITLFSALLLPACQAEEKVDQTKTRTQSEIKQDLPLVVLSKSDKGSESYRMYRKWLEAVFRDSCVIVDVYQKDPSFVDSVMRQANGLLLCGGPDIDPARYGKEDERDLCHMEPYRDSLEFGLFRMAQERKVPTFAICRGFQLTNVYTGGTLHTDIPSQTKSEIHQKESNDAHHTVYIRSAFGKMGAGDSVEVNSNHHQGIEKLGKGLKVLAKGKDSLVEAFASDHLNLQPLIGVQWHPERLPWKNPMSVALARQFFKDHKVIR